MKFVLAAVCVCLAALMAAPVCASDFSFGSTARSVGMGGAGLALGDNSGTGIVLNPAAPAASGARTRFIFPGLEFHSTGASFSDLADSVDKLGSDNDNDTLSLVNDFAKHTTTLSAGLVTGFAGPFGITAAVDAEALIVPGADAAKWANADLQFDSGSVNLSQAQAALDNTNLDATITSAQGGDTVAANASFDAYLNELSQNYVTGGYVYGPGIAYSHGFTTGSGGKLWLGTNISFLHSEAHQWQVQAARNGDVTGTGGSVSADVSFDAVETTKIKNTTTKMDLGLIYRPSGSKLQYGAVVESLIEPDLDGIPNRKDGRSISLGAAYQPSSNLAVALDIVNLNSANDQDAQLRMGGEFKLGKWFALRAGYSGSNWTYGVGVFGVNMAFAGKTAQLITNVLKY